MIPLEECSRLPAPGDNVAIAARRLERGTVLQCGERRFALHTTVLEGHRFVFAPVAAGSPLLSWGLPFGDAARDLEPGDYLCNERMLRALGARSLDFELPETPNFTDRFDHFDLAVDRVAAGAQVAPVPTAGTFHGFARPQPRGTGTRNFLVVIGLTSNDAALATAVAERLRE